MFYENALHRDAGLSGISKTAIDTAFGSVRKISVTVNDDGGIASQFEHNFFLSRVVLDGPANGGAAGETDELDALVGDEQAGIFIREQDGVDAAVGPSRFVDHFRPK